MRKGTVMRHKRLRHTCQNLGQMFCGWQLMHDWQVLTELGSGRLEIDLLAGKCAYDGQEIPALAMLDVLDSWLRDDLDAHGIPFAVLHEAKLTVEFETERHEGQRDQCTSWARPTREYIGCKLSCTGTITTDERTYIATYEDAREWSADYAGITNRARKRRPPPRLLS